MDAEVFGLTVTTIILQRRVRKRRFKRKPRKQWVRAQFKDREEKGAKWEHLYHTNFVVFLKLLLKYHHLLKYLFFFPMFMIFFRLMLF